MPTMIFAVFRGKRGKATEPETVTPGELVVIELPPNCAVLGMAGRGPADIVRVLDIAHRIGEHWRTQEGVNGALLDELGQATATFTDEITIQHDPDRARFV